MAPPLLISVVLGLSTALFLGYCVYFDRKRRSSPDFRKRLYERRRRLRSGTTSSPMGGPRGEGKQAALESYFLREMRSGEELISQGRMDDGLTHFANAVALCAQPDKVMQALEATLPTHMFEMLISKLKGLQMMSDAGTEEWSEDKEGSSTQDP